MVLTEFLEMVLEVVVGWLGLHGVQVGALAVLLVGAYHLRHIAGALVTFAAYLQVAILVGTVLGVLFFLGVAFGAVNLDGGAIGHLFSAGKALLSGVL